MPNPILAQLDPRHMAAAERVSQAIADVLDGEILAPWEVCLVLSLATYRLHAGLAQYMAQQDSQEDLAAAIQRWIAQQGGPHA